MISLLKKILSLAKIFFLSKKTFRLPKKNNLLILSDTGSRKIKDHILGHSDYNVLDDKNLVINLPIFFMSLFYILKYKKYFYEVTFINYAKPKLALTWIDTSYHYCNILKYVPSCKLGLIQNGRANNSRFQSINSLKFECDYYFINGEYVKSYFEKYLSAKFIVSGSAIANNFNLSEFKEIKRIQWVSHYRDLSKLDTSIAKSTIENFYISPVEFILPEIEKFCKKNNIVIEILGRGPNEKEYLFFKNFWKETSILNTKKHLKENINHMLPFREMRLSRV